MRQPLPASAAAIGGRLALARLGDHLTSDERDPIHDMQRLNVLLNVALLLETSNDPSGTSAQIVEELGTLHWVKSARLAPNDDDAEHVRVALGSETLVVSTGTDGQTHVASR